MEFLKNAKKLSKNNLRQINGGIGKPPICKCSCTGEVLGPLYCKDLISCPQVITC